MAASATTTACCGARRRRQSPSTTAGEPLGDQRRPAFVASDDGGHPQRDPLGLGMDASRTATLVPSSQNWSLDDRTDPEAVPSEEQLTVVIDPKPPIAEPDAFGVRAGSLVSLPVLMNDHDPNEDVLSIDPASVAGLDPGFGTASITDDGQRITVRVAPDATRLGDARLRRHRRHGARAACCPSRRPCTLTVARRCRELRAASGAASSAASSSGRPRRSRAAAR